jgi:hypothetical protein
MARGRFLSRSISVSEQIDALIDAEGYEAGLLMTWMVAHLDVEGRMKGNPKTVRGTVCPLRLDLTTKKVARILKAANDVGLIRWYVVGEQQCIWFPEFHNHQKNLRKDREGTSQLPEYSGSSPGVIPEDSRSTPAEVKLREEKSSEDKSISARSCKSTSEPPVYQIPLAGKKDPPFPITKTMIEEWQGTFPGLDVHSEVRKCIQWNRDNPKRRKTKRGIRGHISSWLSRAQDRGNGGRAEPVDWEEQRMAKVREEFLREDT